MGRFFSYALIALGLYFSATAAYDEYRGVAVASSPGRSAQQYVVNRQEDEQKFRGLMAYEWGRACVLTLAGFIVLGFCGRSGSEDPFAPNFGGKASHDELDRTLSDEDARRRGRPVD